MTRPSPSPRLDTGIPELCSLHEAAAELGTSPQGMRTGGGTGGYEARYGLPSTRAGRLRLYRAADVTAVAAGHLPSNDPLPPLVSLAETAAELGLTRRQTYVHYQRGRLPGRPVADATVLRAAVVEYLRASVAAVQGTQPPPAALPEGLAEDLRGPLWEAARRISDQTPRETNN